MFCAEMEITVLLMGLDAVQCCLSAAWCHFGKCCSGCFKQPAAVQRCKLGAFHFLLDHDAHFSTNE